MKLRHAIDAAARIFASFFKHGRSDYGRMIAAARSEPFNGCERLLGNPVGWKFDDDVSTASAFADRCSWVLCLDIIALPAWWRRLMLIMLSSMKPAQDDI
jgi:hypothetical protein